MIVKQWMSTACISLFVLGSAAWSADAPANAWCVLVRQSDTWTKAPVLAQKTEVFCHFYGLGKFKVFVKSGGKTSGYTIDSPVDYMPVSFGRLLSAGESEMMVQVIPDPRYPKPVVLGLIATADRTYAPDPLDLKYPLFCRCRNLSDVEAVIEVTVANQSEAKCFSYPGFISGKGFVPSGVLQPRETSCLVNFSPYLLSRTVLIFKLHNGTTNTAVDLDFYSDPVGANLIQTLSFRGNDAIDRLLILYPQPDNTLKWSTPAEIIRKGHALLDEAAREDAAFRRPVPKKAYVNASILDAGDDLETFQNELALARRVGVNSAYNKLGRMDSRRAELGFQFGWDMAVGSIPIRPDFLFDPKVAAEYAVRSHSSGSVPRRTPIMLVDEPAFQGIAKNPALDERFRAWMQKKNMTPADAGCANWDEVKAIAPSAENKKLSVVSRAFQVAQYVDYFTGYAAAFSAIGTNFEPAVNWGVSEYMNGLNMDLWEMYRRPGFGIVWGEDWYVYEPRGGGSVAWYADLMRSQQKYRSLPMGVYPILGWGFSPAVTSMKYYERMMRGCYTFETYNYSPRGHQCNWLEQPDALLNIARLHRDLAAVEDILVGGRVIPAKVAILYPNSSLIWDPGAAQDAQALYTACLQAGIPNDILTEQDLVDGYANAYKLILCAGPNIRRDALSALDGFINAGGDVVWSAPDIRDPFDDLIPQAAELFGARSLVCLTNSAPGRWVYEFQGAKALDTVKWDGKEIAVYCQKSKIEPLPASQVVAVFSNGSPAVIKTSRGKGMVYLYGFAPGLSCMKADYGGNNNSLATVLCSNNNERALATLPVKDIENAVRVSEPMVSARMVANAVTGAAFVGLVDYGLGGVGRTMKNPDQKSINLEKMEPFPVAVTIVCPAKPEEVYGVRAGKVSWKYKDGTVTVRVPLQGVEMIVLKGKRLVE